jgi:hypothetical protein
MADAPVTKKDLDALQKNLQKQIDDLRKWAKDEDDARIKEGDARAKDIKALGDWAKGELDKLAKAISSK